VMTMLHADRVVMISCSGCGASLPLPTASRSARCGFCGRDTSLAASPVLPDMRSLALPELRRRQGRLRRQLQRLAGLRRQHRGTTLDWGGLATWSLPVVALLMLMAGIATGRLPWLVAGLLCLPLSITVPLAGFVRPSTGSPRHSNSIADQEIQRLTRELNELNRALSFAVEHEPPGDPPG